MTKDIPDFDAIVAGSSTLPRIRGFYPGSGPDGSNETDAPDGPYLPLSPLMFAAEARALPAYIEDAAIPAAVQAAGGSDSATAEDPRALEKALMQELGLDESMMDEAEASLDASTPGGAKADEEVDLDASIEDALSADDEPADEAAAPRPPRSPDGPGQSG